LLASERSKITPSMELIVKLCAGSSKTALLFLLIGVGLVASTVGTSKAEASTEYETSAPLQTVVLTNVFGSGQSKNTTYMKVPLGTQFDRVALSLTNAGSFYYGVRNDPNGDSFPCTDVPMSNCYDDDTWVTGPSGPVTGTLKSTGVYEYVVGTTTITTSGMYFFFEYNVNISQTTGMDVTNASNGVSYSYNEYVGTDTYSTVMPAMLFCNGVCTEYQFSPVPNLTAQPWARLVSPASGSTQSSNVTLQIETNSGTSTADTITVRYLSNFQSIAPDVYSVNTSGLQSKTISKSFPAINDTVQIEISMSTGSTTVVTSPTYSIRISDSLISDDASTENQVNCDSTSGIGWAICSTAVLLFIPSDASINRFTDVYDTLSTKFPFAYLTDFRDSITSIYTGSTTASLGLTVPFGDVGDITLISADLVSDVPFTSTIRTILGALIWLMLASQIWRRGQTIFNQKTT